MLNDFVDCEQFLKGVRALNKAGIPMFCIYFWVIFLI